MQANACEVAARSCNQVRVRVRVKPRAQSPERRAQGPRGGGGCRGGGERGSLGTICPTRPMCGNSGSPSPPRHNGREWQHLALQQNRCKSATNQRRELVQLPPPEKKKKSSTKNGREGVQNLKSLTQKMVFDGSGLVIWKMSHNIANIRVLPHLIFSLMWPTPLFSC